jgi:predicted nuclease of predicted toxin-antitoxin system
VKFNIDEDISPKVAEILRIQGIDGVSAHDIGLAGASDEDQFAEAVSRKCAIITRNREDFITRTVQAFENRSPHYGLVVVSHNISGSDFGDMAALLEKCAKKSPKGMGAYPIEFIPFRSNL